MSAYASHYVKHMAHMHGRAGRDGSECVSEGWVAGRPSNIEICNIEIWGGVVVVGGTLASIIRSTVLNMSSFSSIYE